MTAPAAPTVTVPPVIAVIPADLGPVEVLVRHQPWGEVEVDVRPAGSNATWTPLSMMGGSFEVRSQ